MYAIRRATGGGTDDKSIIDVRVVPKGTVVIKHHERDMWIIRRERIGRVFVEHGVLTWMNIGEPQEWSISLPVIDGVIDAFGRRIEKDRVIAREIYDSIVNVGEDVVWLEEISTGDEIVTWRCIPEHPSELDR
jgi:hypothetical protein